MIPRQRNTELANTRHRQVTGITQAGGQPHDVARILDLDPDSAQRAIERARQWHKANPGDWRPYAVPAPLPRINQAACTGHNPELFYYGRETYPAAQAICGGCPIRHPCAEYALTTAEPYGVWGGLTPEQRDTIRARRARRHP